jgi:hypothetical protein
MKRTLFSAVGILAFAMSGWAVAQEANLGAQADVNAGGAAQAGADVRAGAQPGAPADARLDGQAGARGNLDAGPAQLDADVRGGADARLDARDDRTDERLDRRDDRLDRREDRLDQRDDRLDRQTERFDDRGDAIRDDRIDAGRIEGGRAGMASDQWRYRFHDGRWWYWLPSNSWVVWSNSTWVPYDTWRTTYVPSSTVYTPSTTYY